MTLDVKDELEEPTIPEGIPLASNITPKLQDYNTRKLEDLERNQFMVAVPSVPPNADIVFVMEWVCRLE